VTDLGEHSHHIHTGHTHTILRRVMGLDASLSSFGVALLEEKGGEWGAETTTWGPRLSGATRLRWFKEKLERTVVDFGPLLVMLEGYAYNKGQGAHQMGELGGIVRWVLHEMGAPTVIVPPAKLKKFVTGRGNAGKPDVMMGAYKRFGIERHTQDEVEAECLAVMGAMWKFGMEIKLPKAQLAVLDELALSPHHGGIQS